MQQQLNTQAHILQMGKLRTKENMQKTNSIRGLEPPASMLSRTSALGNVNKLVGQISCPLVFL